MMEKFIDIVSSVDLPEQINMLKFLQKLVDTNKKAVKLSNYVTVEQDYISEQSDNFKEIEKNLEDLKLWSSPRKGVSTVWLTLNDKPYTWMSAKGPVVNQSQSLVAAPAIDRLRNKINYDKGLGFDSVLVTLFPSEKTTLSLHADDESTLDQTHPIGTFSVGAPRPVQFYRTTQHHSEAPLHEVLLHAGSLYIMHAGCQKLFKHRIPAGKFAGRRYSLSFRRLAQSSVPFPVQKVENKPSENVVCKVEKQAS